MSEKPEDAKESKEAKKSKDSQNQDNKFKKKSSIAKKVRRPTNIFTFLIAVLEVVAIVLIELQFNAICIQTMEMGPQVYALLMCSYTFGFPDLFMFVLMFLNDRIFFRPFGVLFHICGFFFLIGSSLTVIATLTFCGDPSQFFFLAAGLFCFFSGLMHLICMIFLLHHLPKETFPLLRKICLCKCKEKQDD